MPKKPKNRITAFKNLHQIEIKIKFEGDIVKN